MKKTAILLDFEAAPASHNDRIFDAICEALAGLGIEGSMTLKDYDDEYGGPVIYFP